MTGRPPLLKILGAGTCVPDRARHSASYHLDLGTASVLIDCGPGTLHGFDEFGVKWKSLTHVAISHYHTDHVGDLAAILFALEHGARPRRTEPLTLIGPVGFSGFVRELASVLGDHILSPSFEVRVAEVAPDLPYEDLEGGFALEARATPHTEESLAYRIEGTWGSMGYTGDTGPSDDIAQFLRGCGVLVGECSLTDPPAMDRHLSPLLLAALARAARPDLLIVTHVYPPLTPDDAVQKVSERYDGVTVAGADGMTIRLGSEGPTIAPGATAVYT